MSIWGDIYSIFLDNVEPIWLDVYSDPQNVVHQYRAIWTYLDTIWVATPYTQIHTWIERYKYFSQRELGMFLSKLYINIMHVHGEFKNQDHWVMWNIPKKYDTLVVPVPMHWTRYMFRGYDHMRLLAKHFCSISHIPWADLLIAKYSRRQVTLSRSDRIKNRENAYLFRQWFPVPRRVILLDDVVTTGATLHACARVLKAYGVQEVHAYILSSKYLS